MKSFTIYARIVIEVERTIDAENFAEAETKAKAMKQDRWVRKAPGASITDHEFISGMSIHEERG